MMLFAGRKTREREEDEARVRFRSASYSDVGGRDGNEDAVSIRRMGSRSLCAVLADGLGGHGGGETASAAAVRAILDGWTGGASPDELQELVQSAHRTVVALQTPSCQMKTTVVILTVDDGRFAWAYAGDSRLYHFVNGKLVWQSRDHSASQIAVLLGQITPEQIRFHEDRSCIFRALGQQGDVEAETGGGELEAGEHAFLLCSDGFWEYVYEQEMERELSASSSSDEWLEAMRRLMKERTPPDNDNNTAAAIWAAQ